jgi:allophanate hydrolase
VNGVAVGSNIVVTLVPGDQLVVAAGPSGSWAYLAVAGELVAPRWLGHTATHSLSGLGGGRVTVGLDVEVSAARADPILDGAVAVFDSNDLVDGAVRVVLGPQDHRFSAGALEHFVAIPFLLTEGFDRMGVRLDGPLLDLDAALSIPSEPIVRGSVQVAGDGVATVLLADHQTTGGYPKIATVVGADLDAFCQLRPGNAVRFIPVMPAEAIAIARTRAAAFEAFLDDDLLGTRQLARRLTEADLIGDVGVD